VHDARPDIPSGLANGFAYDTARDQFFFLSADKQLQFWGERRPLSSVRCYGCRIRGLA
jgi:hypothetical protein